MQCTELRIIVYRALEHSISQQRHVSNIIRHTEEPFAPIVLITAGRTIASICRLHKPNICLDAPSRPQDIQPYRETQWVAMNGIVYRTARACLLGK